MGKVLIINIEELDQSFRPLTKALHTWHGIIIVLPFIVLHEDICHNWSVGERYVQHTKGRGFKSRTFLSWLTRHILVPCLLNIHIRCTSSGILKSLVNRCVCMCTDSGAGIQKQKCFMKYNSKIFLNLQNTHSMQNLHLDRYRQEHRYICSLIVVAIKYS